MVEMRHTFGRRVFRSASALGLLLALSIGSVSAQATDEFWPGASYNANIPTLKSVLGYANGEQITSPEQVLTYLDALVAAAPEQTKLVQYATTWEGRPLKYLVISSAANIKNLTANQTQMQKLVDPRRYQPAERDALLREIKPVSWLSYGVHGNEVTSTDAALLAMYHLLAAKGDATVDNILANSIVVLDPNQNPDGRARFVHHYQQNLGLKPAVHQLSAEHREAWPGGRTNHYLFDMNRDWFAITQPETKGRIEHILKFFPVVHADVHEMGVDRSYYFPPPAEPFNPYITDTQKGNLNLYGKGNASAFDRFNFDYFTREVYDAHYAGYGDTWPAFHGATGMTFEMASPRGLVQRKDSGELLTYRDGVHRHFLTSIATMKTTAQNGRKLLRDMADYRAAAIDDDRHYIFSSGDESLRHKLAEKLQYQGIEVSMLSSATRACGKSHPAGSLVVKAGQPAGNLVRTLLEENSAIEEDFWLEQERKRAKGLEIQLYDLLAWSLPGLYGLDAEICDRSLDGLLAFPLDRKRYGKYERAGFAYLIPNKTSASMQFLAAALRADLPVLNIDADFTMNDVEFARGTLVIKVADANDAIHKTIHGLAAKFDVELVATSSSWTSSGVNFGSPQATLLKAPEVALVWNTPTFTSAAGNTRFVIERLLGYPVTTIRVPHLSSRELSYFDVLIFPEGSGYASALGAAGMENIQAWVRNGGVLITAGNATKLLMEDGLGLLSTQLEANLDAVDGEESDGVVAATTIESEESYQTLLSEGATRPDNVPGVILRGEVNSDHWLSAGVAPQMNFVVEGSDVYTPLKHGQGTNVVRYAASDELLHGGYLWEENRKQMAFKPAVMARGVGAGEVIGFTTDPAFRGYLDGAHVMLGNAIFKGPSR
jgi:hypothetical protein